jgi:heat-inducible transcriptional repressor
MGELAELGLVQKSHASSGRLPTEDGLRFFVDQLIANPAELASYQQRELAHSFERVVGDDIVHLASRILSDRTRQLGFVVAPTLQRVILRHASLVRLSAERVLVVLISASGQSHRVVVQYQGDGDQSSLDRMATVLNQHLEGRNLGELRDILERELRKLQQRAGSLAKRALELGLQAITKSTGASPSLVIASRMALLDQPEFADAERIRELFAAVETNERLLAVLEQILDESADGVCVALGSDFEEAGLHRCAVVAAPYGGEASLGVLGVICASRMDYARIIPLVGYCSQLVTEKLTTAEN